MQTRARILLFMGSQKYISLHRFVTHFPIQFWIHFSLILGAKMDPIWDPFGSLWDTFLHPPVSRGARSLPEASRRPPGGLPAASRWPPRVSRRPPGDLPGHPGRLPGPPWSSRRPLLAAPGRSGRILGQQLGTLGGCSGSLWTALGRSWRSWGVIGPPLAKTYAL